LCNYQWYFPVTFLDIVSDSVEIFVLSLMYRLEPLLFFRFFEQAFAQIYSRIQEKCHTNRNYYPKHIP